MFQMVGITLGTPSGSPLNVKFVSQGREWTIRERGDTLIIKGDRLRDEKWEIVLFGALFHSIFHFISDYDFIIYMTNKAKVRNIMLIIRNKTTSNEFIFILSWKWKTN